MFTIEEIKVGLNIMRHPIQATKKEKSIKDSIKFYYKLSIIPLVLYVLFDLLSLNAQYKHIIAVLIVNSIFQIFIFWVLVPVGLFISALIYHEIGKYLWSFKNIYSNTFGATVYGAVPFVLFMWVTAIFLPSRFNIINVTINIIYAMLLIWSLVVLVIALANLQDTTKLRSFTVVISTILVVALVIVFIELRFYYSWIRDISSLIYGTDSALLSAVDKLLHLFP